MNKVKSLVFLIGCLCLSSCTKMDRNKVFTITLNYNGESTSYEIEQGEKIHIDPVSKTNFTFLGYYNSNSPFTDANGDMLEEFNYSYSFELTPKFEGNKFDVKLRDAYEYVEEKFSVKYYEAMPDIFTDRTYDSNLIGFKCNTVMVASRDGYLPGFEILTDKYAVDSYGAINLVPIYSPPKLRNVRYTYSTDGGQTFKSEIVRTDALLSSILPKDSNGQNYLWARKSTYFYDDFLDPYKFDVSGDVDVTTIGTVGSYDGYTVYKSYDGKKEFYFVSGSEKTGQIQPMPGIKELYIYGRKLSSKISIKIPELDYPVSVTIQDATFKEVDFFYNDELSKDDIQNVLNIVGDVKFSSSVRNPNYPAITCKNLKINVFENASLQVYGNSGAVGRTGENGTTSHPNGYQGYQGYSGADAVHVLKQLVINNKGNITFKGGVGGRGGSGGDGIDSETHAFNINGRNAGNGGDGGKGGTGGNGIVFEDDAVFVIEEGLKNITVSGGSGGSFGLGGYGGAASSFWPFSHEAGRSGNYGTDGDNGQKYIGSQGEILDAQE